MCAIADNSRVVDENSLKTAFIYNFGKFVQWPDDAERTSEQFVVCISGKSPLNAALNTIHNKELQNRTVQVVNMDKNTHAKNCQLLFINKNTGNIKTLLNTTKQHNILTVSDSPNFTSMGGIIEIFSQGNKIRFKINLNAAKLANLSISSRLLHLAETVYE